MITILHGENIVASRNRLSELRSLSQGKEIISLPAPLDITVLVQSLESASLFGNDRLVIIEGALSKIGRKQNDEVVTYLTKGSFTLDCVIWESKTISLGLLSRFPKGTKVEHFKLSKTLFKWLDSLRPQNTPEMLLLFHECLKEEEVEFLFAMLVRQIRLLLAVEAGATKLEELVRLAPWQRGKLGQQARQYTQPQLISLYQRLYELDREQKTGENILPLADSLDIFLTEV